MPMDVSFGQTFAGFDADPGDDRNRFLMGGPGDERDVITASGLVIDAHGEVTVHAPAGIIAGAAAGGLALVDLGTAEPDLAGYASGRRAVWLTGESYAGKYIPFLATEIMQHADALAGALQAGGLAIPPPLLSRTYQVLSDGTAAAMQARKVSYVAFPFPLRQLLVRKLSSTEPGAASPACEPEAESLRLPMTGVTHQTRTSAGPLGAADAAVACAPSTDATPVRKREAPIAPTTLLTAPPCSIILWTLRFASLLHSLCAAREGDPTRDGSCSLWGRERRRSRAPPRGSRSGRAC